MKRSIVIGLATAIFMGLFAGYAAAGVGEVGAPAPAATDSATDDVTLRRIIHFCRQVLGEDEMSEQHIEKCRELWKRWCEAHPDARICHRDHPHPCRVIGDQPSDRRCPTPHPCRTVDVVSDRCPRPVPPPCHLDSVEARELVLRHGLTIDQIRDRYCLPPDRPTDRPTDRPVDRRIDKPTDRPVDRPTDRSVPAPSDKPIDQPSDQPSDTVLDRTSDGDEAKKTDLAENDVYVRTNDADS